MTDTYDELYNLFVRRYHPAIAAILAHEYATHRYTGIQRIGQRLERQAAA